MSTCLWKGLSQYGPAQLFDLHTCLLWLFQRACRLPSPCSHTLNLGWTRVIFQLSFTHNPSCLSRPTTLEKCILHLHLPVLGTYKARNADFLPPTHNWAQRSQTSSVTCFQGIQHWGLLDVVFTCTLSLLCKIDPSSISFWDYLTYVCGIMCPRRVQLWAVRVLNRVVCAAHRVSRYHLSHWTLQSRIKAKPNLQNPDLCEAAHCSSFSGFLGCMCLA